MSGTCCVCDEEFSCTTTIDPFWGEMPDEDTCPGCEGDGECHTDGCGAKASTRMDVDGAMSKYACLCNKCYKTQMDFYRSEGLLE
jgi:hypothetical protein